MGRDERRWLLAAITCAILLRLGLVAAVILAGGETTAFQTEDTPRYLALAESLARTGAYSYQGTPEIFRPPGFPALVAIGIWLGHPTAVTIAFHALFGAVATGCCFAAGRAAASTRVGLTAAWLYALEPGQLAWSAALLTEPSFVVLVAMSVASACVYLNRGRFPLLMLTVAAASVSTYVRMIGYWLPFALVAATAALQWKVAGRVRWRHVAGAATMAVLVTGAWHVRNVIQTGYRGFSTQLERVLFLQTGGSVAARAPGVVYEDARESLWQDLQRDADDGGAETVAAAMRRRGIEHMVTHPLSFGASYASGITAVILHPGTSAFMRLFRIEDRPASLSVTRMLVLGRWRDAWDRATRKDGAYWTLTAVLFAVNLGYLTLAAAGFWRGRRVPHVWLAAAVVAYFLMLSGGPDADSRRRVPMVPALCLLAAYALSPASRETTRPWATTTDGSS